MSDDRRDPNDTFKHPYRGYSLYNLPCDEARKLLGGSVYDAAGRLSFDNYPDNNPEGTRHDG